LPFLEAIRQFSFDMGKENVLYIHLTLVPYIKSAGELKTKPTQHSVQKLREIGIQPQIILCRSERPLNAELKDKIALFCNVEKDAVINAVDVETIYRVPLEFHREGLDERIVEYLNIWTREPQMDHWEELVRKINNRNKAVNIAVVGKYVSLTESYKSLNEALVHGGIVNDAHVNLKFVNSMDLQEEKGDISKYFEDIHGVLVPGGFGVRGTEGKILAIKYARENGIPLFGICLGMQLAVVEFARHVCNMENANSTEFDADTPWPVIDLLPGQIGVERKGGTMRLGAYKCVLTPNTKAMDAYKSDVISERHRHRYEFNNKYEETLVEHGLVVSGKNPETSLVEIVELKDHPWFLGCQFHPEFKSKPMNPHPLFREFIRASLAYSNKT